MFETKIDSGHGRFSVIAFSYGMKMLILGVDCGRGSFILHPVFYGPLIDGPDILKDFYKMAKTENYNKFINNVRNVELDGTLQYSDYVLDTYFIKDKNGSIKDTCRINDLIECFEYIFGNFWKDESSKEKINEIIETLLKEYGFLSTILGFKYILFKEKDKPVENILNGIGSEDIMYRMQPLYTTINFPKEDLKLILEKAGGFYEMNCNILFSEYIELLSVEKLNYINKFLLDDKVINTGNISDIMIDVLFFDIDKIDYFVDNFSSKFNITKEYFGYILLNRLISKIEDDFQIEKVIGNTRYLCNKLKFTELEPNEDGKYVVAKDSLMVTRDYDLSNLEYDDFYEGTHSDKLFLDNINQVRIFIVTHSFILEETYLYKLSYYPNDVMKLQYKYFKFVYDYVFEIKDEEICFDFFNIERDYEKIKTNKLNDILFGVYIKNDPKHFASNRIIFFERPKYKFSFKVLEDYYEGVVFPLLESEYKKQVKENEQKRKEKEEKRRQAEEYQKELEKKREKRRLKNIEKQKKKEARKKFRLEQIEEKMKKQREELEKFRSSHS